MCIIIIIIFIIIINYSIIIIIIIINYSRIMIIIIITITIIIMYTSYLCSFTFPPTYAATFVQLLPNFSTAGVHAFVYYHYWFVGERG